MPTDFSSEIMRPERSGVTFLWVCVVLGLVLGHSTMEPHGQLYALFSHRVSRLPGLALNGLYCLGYKERIQISENTFQEYRQDISR